MDNKLTVTTIKVSYGRTVNLQDYNSLRSDVEIWASIEPDADVAQAVSGLRTLARNHVMVEVANVVKAVRARTQFLYMNKPLVGTELDDLTGDAFYSGEAIAPEVREMLVDMGINPEDVFVRHTQQMEDDNV